VALGYAGLVGAVARRKLFQCRDDAFQLEPVLTFTHLRERGPQHERRRLRRHGEQVLVVRDLEPAVCEPEHQLAPLQHPPELVSQHRE
jgi:hypothetical protein